VARRNGSYDGGLAKLVRERLTYNLSWTITPFCLWPKVSFDLKWPLLTLKCSNSKHRCQATHPFKASDSSDCGI
jgi:hypothetical protein